ncbi:Manganese/iron superoxide dismutase [Nemania sp. NC0429]|nr:Manganese/iron superoxide dismutase [Nemania sp. NC0429]
MLRPRLRIPQSRALLRPTRLFNRSVHSVPILDHFRHAQGVPGLLSPDGFSIAWTKYMEHIVDRLNILTAGTDYESQTPLTILKSAARDPAQAAVFNYASMAHNNHLFFSQLVNLETVYENRAAAAPPPPASQTDISPGTSPATENVAVPGSGSVQFEPSEDRIPPKLRQELERNFSSLETLRREFLSTALGMFGPGFVWLVKNANTMELRILTTYLAGSPYTAAHWRRQGVDFNTSSADRNTVSAFYDRTQAGAGNGAGHLQPQAPGGTDVVPLLCLNTWEHVWLVDYGITGKGDYVQQWWETIDWQKVDALTFPIRRDGFKRIWWTLTPTDCKIAKQSVVPDMTGRL